MLRVPGWTDGARILVNGEAVAAGARGFKGSNASSAPGCYHEIRRRWRAGDTVIVDMNLPVRLMQAHHKVEEARNQVAVMRGPVVYCLESPDLPKDVAVHEVLLDHREDLAPRHEPALLGGVTVLEGKAHVVPSAATPSEARGEAPLYRPLARGGRRTIDVRLIPYYTWSNRGESRMSVWLPLV
jgi:DUF1680 family protein